MASSGAQLCEIHDGYNSTTHQRREQGDAQLHNSCERACILSLREVPNRSKGTAHTLFFNVYTAHAFPFGIYWPDLSLAIQEWQRQRR